jgi:hypothetical protein
MKPKVETALIIIIYRNNLITVFVYLVTKIYNHQ